MRGSGCRSAVDGASLGDVLAPARTVDVDADGVHREAVKDRGGQGGVAEIAPPVAQRDVRGDRGGDSVVPTVDEVVQGVGSGWLVRALLDLAETNVVNDEELGASPALEPARVGAIGEAGVEVVEQVDTASVAHGDALLAGSQAEGLEQVALARAVGAGDHEVLVAVDEVEPGEFKHEGLIEAGLEGPVEGLEGLALGKPAGVDAPRDALLELVRGFGTEDVLEERGRTGPLAGRPGELPVEFGEGLGQSEELEVSSESGEDRLVAGATALGLDAGGAVSLGHAVVSSGCHRGPEVSGKRSYSVRSRGTVRA